MMVLRLWDRDTGVLTFDSTQAAGGVCLGFYTVPPGGGEAKFPSYTTASGVALTASGRGAACTIDTTKYGYLRFEFPASVAGYTYALFAK